jgi:hypothetical protein
MLVSIREASGNALAGRIVAWESSDPAVATVSPSGLVQAVAVGASTVTATSEGKPGTAGILVIPEGGGPPNLCQQIAGASVIAYDGQFLGRLAGELNSESIYNDLGPYGSTLSPTSIYNDLGQYGGKLSSMSPFNELASNPPILVRDGNFLAYFTVNQFKNAGSEPALCRDVPIFLIGGRDARHNR